MSTLERIYEYALNQRVAAEQQRQQQLREAELKRLEEKRLAEQQAAASIATPEVPQEELGFFGGRSVKDEASDLSADLGKALLEFEADGKITIPNKNAFVAGIPVDAPDTILSGKEAEKHLKELTNKFRQVSTQAQQFDKKAGFLTRTATDVLSQPEQAGSLVGAVAGGAIAGPAGSAAGAAIGMVPVLEKAFYSEYLSKRLAGVPEDKAYQDAWAKLGIEGATEMIPGMGKIASLGKTILGKTAAKAGVGAAEETAAEVAGQGFDKVRELTSQDEATRKAYQEAQPEDRLAAILRSAAAGGLAGGAIGLPGSYAEVLSDKAKNTKIEMPKTGDPDTDAGIEAAQKIADSILGERSSRSKERAPDIGETLFSQDNVQTTPTANLGKEFKQTFGPAVGTQGELFPQTDPTIGDLFGGEVPAAQAEAKRKAAEAVAPRTVETGRDSRQILEVPAQTTDAELRARAEQEKAVKDRRDAEEIEQLRRSLEVKRIRGDAAGMVGVEQLVIKRLKEKYPEALSTKRTPEVLAAQEAFAREYDNITGDQTAVRGVLYSDRVKQIEQREAMLEKRTLEPTPDTTSAPVQNELQFGPAQGDLFTQQQQTPRVNLTKGTPLTSLRQDVPAIQPTVSTEFKKSEQPKPKKLTQKDAVSNAEFTTPTAQSQAPADFGFQTPQASANNVSFNLGPAAKQTASKTSTTADTSGIPKSVLERRAKMGKSNVVVEDEPQATTPAPKASRMFDPNASVESVVAKVRNYKQAITTEAKTADKLLDLVDRTETTKNAEGKRLVEKLRGNTTLKNTKVVILDSKSILERFNSQSDNKIDGIRGMYEASTDTIYLADSEGDGANLKENGIDAEVMLHELAHAATVKEVNNPKRLGPRGKEVQAAVGELNFIRQELKKFLAKDYTLTPPQKFIIENATKDVDELIAYTYTSSTFQNVLRTRTPTLWERLKNSLMVLLKFKPSEATLLDRILNVTDKIIDAQEAAAQRQEQFAAKYNNNAMGDVVDATGDFTQKKLEDARDRIAKEQSVPIKQVVDAFDGFKTIPVGTKVLATHGLKYKEPTMGTVVGTRPFKNKDKMYNLPLVDFGDGTARPLFPYDIKEVYAPRSVGPKAAAAPKQTEQTTTAEEDLAFKGFFDIFGVKTKSTANTDQRRGKVSEFMNVVMKLVDIYGGKSKKFTEASEAAQGRIQRVYAEEQAARERMNSLIQESGYKWKSKDHTPEGIARMRANPDKRVQQLANEMAAARERYKTLALTLRDEYLAGKEVLTKKDLAIANKITEQLDEYLTRAYIVDINNRPTAVQAGPTVGEKYKKDVVTAWNRAKNAKPGDPVLASRHYIVAKEAVRYFKERVFGFAPGWQASMPMEQLRLRYKLLAGHGFGNVDPNTLQPRVDTREDMIADIERILEKVGPRIDETSEQLMLDVLGANADGSPRKEGVAFNFYRGPNAIDQTIIKPRKDVPWEIRELWGEIKDPFDAMFITMQRLANTLAKTQMMNEELERGLREGFIFAAEDRPPGDKFNYPISGADYGALNNMYTTQAYKTQLEAMAKMELISNSALEGLPLNLKLIAQGVDKLAWIPRWGKWLDVVLTPDNYIQNAVGSFTNLVMNGNFTKVTPKAVKEGMSIAKQLLYDVPKGNISKETLDVFNAFILDSALVGELKSDFSQGIYADIMKDFMRDYGKTTAERVTNMMTDKYLPLAANKITSAKDKLTDIYAMMDLWSKIANYKAEVARMTDFNKETNQGWSDEKIRRVAAFRTRATNLSQQRAIGLVRGAENMGITTYMVYYTEMLRTSMTNLVVGINDIKAGHKYGSKKLIGHGVARILGTSSSMGINLSTFYGSWMLKAAVLGWAAESALDDETMEKIQKALGSFGAGRTLFPIGADKDGNPMFMDLGRPDPVEPIGSPIREILSAYYKGEDVGDAASRAAEIVSGLFFTNQVWSGLANLTPLYNPNKQGQLEKNSFETYQLGVEMLESLGFSTEWADRLIRTSEKVGPRYASSIVAAYEQDNPVAAKLQALGHPVVTFNPKDSAKFIKIDYDKAVTDARSEMFEAMRAGKVPSEDRLRAMYMDGLKAEREAFEKAVDYVEGARAAGFRNTQIRSFLKDQQMPEAVINNVMRGRFKSNLITESVGRRYEELQKELEDKIEDKAKARQLTSELKRELNGLSRELKYWNGEEE